MSKGRSKRAAGSRSKAQQAAPSATGTGSRAWWQRHDLLGFALLSAAVVLLLYGRVLRAPFVYDDLDQIVNNPSLANWHGMWSRFFLAPVSFTGEFLGRAGGSTYRPLYWLSLMLDRVVWGVEGAGGFHLTNLGLHWLNGVLLYAFLRRIRCARVAAGATVLLWLALPINSEAVAWVSGRAYELSTEFLLGGLLVCADYLGSRRPALLVALCVLAAGALLSHEQGLLLLPLCALLLMMEGQTDRRVWTRVLVPLAVALLIYVVVRVGVGAHGTGQRGAFWAAGLCFWEYARWLLFPVHMSVERSTSLPADRASVAAILSWAMMLFVAGLAFALRRKAPGVAFALAWLWLALLPFCGMVFIYQGMAERFVYMGSIGAMLALVRAAYLMKRPGRRVLWAALGIWAVWSIWRLETRVGDWTDPVQLYAHSLEATPQSASLSYNLGFALAAQGNVDEAVAAYQKAIDLRPGYAAAFASIGDLDAARGQYARALTQYRRALQIHADDPKVLLNEAVALQQLGQLPEAEQIFRRVTVLAPTDSAAWIDLGSLYAQQHRSDEAILSFQRAIQSRPWDPNAYFNLGVIYQQAGQDDLALPMYRAVLRLKPDDPDTLKNMAHLRAAEQR